MERRNGRARTVVKARWLTRSIAAIVSALVVLTIPTGQVLAAPGGDDKGVQKTVTLKKQTPSGLEHVVSCSVYASSPVRYPSVNLIEGIGTITSCWPSDPQTCRIETDVEVYNKFSNLWQVYASGSPAYGPPCKGKKSTARNYSCTSSSTTYSYRTRAYLTIVEDGMPASGVATSVVVNFYCY